VLDCETMPSVDVTAARMLSQLAADLAKRGVRLVLAAEIGQVRDMVAAVSDHGQVPGYHRTVAEAVRAAQAGDAGQPAKEA
jgi:SulP family sulfate permease